MGHRRWTSAEECKLSWHGAFERHSLRIGIVDAISVENGWVTLKLEPDVMLQDWAAFCALDAFARWAQRDKVEWAANASHGTAVRGLQGHGWAMMK